MTWIPQGARRLSGLGLLVLALAACERQAQPAFERPPAPVTVTAAIARDTPLYLEEVGKCVANEVVSVQPQISGRIVKFHSADGADLRQGDLLFTIDPRPVQASVEHAEANVARDQAQARQAEANAARDQAAVQQAEAALIQARALLGQAEANVVRDQAPLANARAQDQRYAELVRQGYVAREQGDQVRTAMETAAATLRANQAMVESGTAAIARPKPTSRRHGPRCWPARPLSRTPARAFAPTRRRSRARVSSWRTRRSARPSMAAPDSGSSTSATS